MIEVVRAGLCDLVVDLGRPGWGALGVPAGGAADPAALAAANRLVGNERGAAALEITLSGPILRFPAGGEVALTGAQFAASFSSGARVAWNQTLAMAAGETLTLGRVEEGCRCWLALRGGLAVPQIMGSRSTFMPAGFGGHFGRALQSGDVLAGAQSAEGFRRSRAHPPACDLTAPLRVVTGPQAGLFDDAGLAAFFAGTYRVDPTS
ncbi:MAG: biotin-dependent carboxyltransferase family protein, partial [Burkholderiaceae bacterium]|nr:biotin-dependent carboxyltransferase family protein [Burkholderiaceae bacterium]